MPTDLSCANMRICVNMNVSEFQIDLFSTTVRIGDSSSPLMVNVFRNVQPLNGREVTATTAPSSKATTTFATKSLMALGLAALYSIFRLG